MTNVVFEFFYCHCGNFIFSQTNMALCLECGAVHLKGIDGKWFTPATIVLDAWEIVRKKRKESDV